MTRALTALALALLSCACVSTRSTRFEPTQHVLLEKVGEEGEKITYGLSSSSSGIPRLVRTRNQEQQIASLGLRVNSIDHHLATNSALTPWRGVVVERVDGSSAAARAGILPGDVLLRLGGIELSSGEQLTDVIQSRMQPGAEVEAELLQVAPDGSYPVTSSRINITLGTRTITISKSDTYPLDGDEGVWRLTGLQVGPLPAHLASEVYNSSEPVTVVAGTLVGSPAYLAGLRPGDRVLSCDGEPIVNNRAISRAVLARANDAKLPADWFEPSLRRDLPDAEGEIRLEVEGPLGPYVTSMDWSEGLSRRSEFGIPILLDYDSDVDSTSWSFLDFIFQFGANYRGSYRDSATRAPQSTWLFSLFPFGMFEFEKTRNSNRYCFFWFIEFEDHH
jgi:hypothetical protein